MTGLEAAADAVLAASRAGEDVEVYGSHRLVTTVDVGAGGELRQVARAEVRGLGVRSVSLGRTGFASTTDLSPEGLAAALGAARTARELAEPDGSTGLPDPVPLPTAAAGWHPSLSGTSLESKIALAADLARRAPTLDRRVLTVDTASYREERAVVTIVSTRGIRAAHERGWAELDLVVVGEDGHGSATGYGHCWGAAPQDCDPAAVADEAVQAALDLLGPRQVLPPGLPVLLAPEVTAAIFAAVGRAFTGPALAGRGPFAGRAGEFVAAPAVTLVDDGLCARSPTAAPFDDEGMPRRLTPLITAGRAVGVLHSMATAPPGEGSTGNARRGSHRSLPVAAPTTLRLHPVGDPVAADAVHVRQLSGEGVGIRPVTGGVDVGLIAHLVRGGAPAGPLPPLPCSTTLREFLRLVDSVGNDARVVPGSPVLAPTVMLTQGLL